jgi:hypothetical protein
VNIVAFALEADGHLRLVVDNHIGAGAILREQHHQLTERDVLLVSVPHEPGALALVLKLAADAGVNVEYAYGSCADRGGSTSVILGVENAVRAAAAAGL